MVMAMRVAGDKEGQGNKRTMESMTRVACNEEGDGDGYKSNDDKGDGQAMGTRVMVTVKVNNK